MKVIFIGGCQRSGTTMLGSIIGGHSDILCIPESLFITDVYIQFKKGKIISISEVWQTILKIQSFKKHWEFSECEIKIIENKINEISSFRELIENIIDLYAKRIKKCKYKHWVCHTPNNIIKSDILLDIFPEAQFIHIIRDGRAIANSLIKADFGANTTYYAAYQWTREVATSFMAQYLSEKQDRFIVVRYEDIVSNPEIEIKKICDFLCINYEFKMLSNTGFVNPRFNKSTHKLIGKNIDITRINNWKKELSEKQISIFEKHAKDTMRLLGYIELGNNYSFPVWTKIKVLIYEHFMGEIVSKIRKYFRYLNSKNKK